MDWVILFWASAESSPRRSFGAGARRVFKEIIIRRQTLEVEKFGLGADGDLIGTFEDGRAFVHFVKHGDVDHGGVGAFGFIELGPQKIAAQPGNLRGGAAIHVVPAKAGENHGEIINLALVAPSLIGREQILRIGGGTGGVNVAANGPGTDDIRQRDDFEELGIAHGVGARSRASGRARQP